MATPIKFDSKVVLVKVETVYGTDAVPTGPANAMQFVNVEIKPMEGADEQRDLEYPYRGAQPQIPVALYSTLSAGIELVGSGTAGTPPAWAALLRALGMTEVIVPGVSVTYSPITDGNESVSIYMWIGATRHVLKGARGTATIEINAQKIPVLKFTLTGTFSVPTEVAVPVADFSLFKAPVVATTANTPAFAVDGVALVLKNYMFDLGNDVQQRLLIGNESILIVDSQEKVTASVEAVPLGTFDPFSKALDQNSNFTVNITHGTDAGYITAIAAPKCQMHRLSGYENDQKILMWPLSMTPLPDSGNDQFSITFT